MARIPLRLRSPLTLGACALFFTGAYAADLDITGAPEAPARVRFLDAADAEHAVLEGSEGWLNASTRVAAQDFVSANGVSLDALGRRLEDDESLAGLQAVIASQQATIASQQTTIASQQTTCTAGPVGFRPIGINATSLPVDSAGRFGYDFSCALLTNSTTACWGHNGGGELGLGDRTQRHTPTVVTTLGIDVARLALGDNHGCALLNDNTTKCWGTNSWGQLGLGDTARRTTPTTVAALGTDVASLIPNHIHSCAVLKDSTAKCWGGNRNGQLGLGDLSNRYTPTAVTALGANVASIASGPANSCAVLTDSTAKCWGYNHNGQLGLGDGCVGNGCDRTTPTAVTALGANVASITLGHSHGCALLKDNTTKCWGLNTGGQLGLGDTTQRNTPTTVTALGTDVASLACGAGYHTCAVLKDSTAKCWGSNGAGQLGLGDTTNRATPTTVTALGADVVSIALGHSHSCALLKDNSVKCWGSHEQGQLGMGYFHVFTTPRIALPSSYLSDLLPPAVTEPLPV